LDQAKIMDVAKSYFSAQKPREDFGDLETRVVTEVLSSSLDAIEFLMHLEEALEVEEMDLEVLGPVFGRQITFEELAQVVADYLEARP
jgi:hypothetical protein